MNLKLLLLRPFNSKTFPTGSFIINTIQKATEKGKIYIHVHAERTYTYLRSYKHNLVTVKVIVLLVIRALVFHNKLAKA